MLALVCSCRCHNTAIICPPFSENYVRIGGGGVCSIGDMLSWINLRLLQCNGRVSAAIRRNLERELTSGPEEVGVISGGCRRVTETLTDITLQNNIVHVRPTWLHLHSSVILLLFLA